MSMMTRPIGRLSANNAAFNWMNAASSLVSFSGSGNSRLLLNSEKSLNANMLNDELMYKASCLSEDSAKQVSDANIKRSFSTFA